MTDPAMTALDDAQQLTPSSDDTIGVAQAAAATLGRHVAPLVVMDSTSIASSTVPFIDAALQKEKEVKKRKFVHTSEAQRRCMLEWLECPGNFDLLASRAGSQQAAPVSLDVKTAKGKKLKKTDGFRALTHYVNSHTKSNWTMAIAKSRFESLMTTYRKAKAQATLPDFVVTEGDRSRGIHDIRVKREALCVYYDRIDALFDPKPDTSDRDTNDTTAESGPAAVPVPSRAIVAIPANAAPLAESLAELADGNASADERQGKRPKVMAENPPRETQPLPPIGQDADADADADATTALQLPLLVSSATTPRSDEVALQQLAIERARLDLLQQQLDVQKRELDLRERELKLQEDQRKHDLHTTITTKLIHAGKSAAEIKAILEAITSTTSTT